MSYALSRLEKKFMNEVKKNNECICYYCGKQITNKDEITIDHKNPLSRGGQTVELNLVICCKDCNMTKSNLNEKEYKEIINKSIEQFKSIELYDILHSDFTIDDLLEYKSKQAKLRAETQKLINLEKSNVYKLAEQLTQNKNKNINIVSKIMASVRTVNSLTTKIKQYQLTEGLATRAVNYFNNGLSSDEIYNKILKIYIEKNRDEVISEIEIA